MFPIDMQPTSKHYNSITQECFSRLYRHKKRRYFVAWPGPSVLAHRMSKLAHRMGRFHTKKNLNYRRRGPEKSRIVFTVRLSHCSKLNP